MKPIELVIFDCDGILVDSEIIANQILADYLTELGLPTTLGQSIQRYMGRSMASCIKDISIDLKRPFTDQDLDRVQLATMNSFKEKLQAVKGIEQVLQLLTIPYCVASSGEHKKMKLTLTKTELLDYFKGNIFSATEVARGKPHPDLFLYAAEKMGVRPENTVVVEDSVPGVQGACAANMRVFGYSALTDEALLSAAGAVVFSSMSELPSLLMGGDELKCINII